MTDRIVSHSATQEYRDNYDRIFGKRTKVEKTIPIHLLCSVPKSCIEQYIDTEMQEHARTMVDAVLDEYINGTGDMSRKPVGLMQSV